MVEALHPPLFAIGQLPSSPTEVTTALVHYYRAEVARMSGWRDRLDRTSNWAITVTAALLSVSLSTATAHHGVLVFAMLLVALLLYVEARRYRFYDVYRMRVRQFERHYFGQLFAGAESVGPEPWLKALSDDLRHPKFRIDLITAVMRRLRRNYAWMFAILLLAWVLKIASPKLQEGTSTDTARPMMTIVDGAALGPLPGWSVVLLVVVFYGTMVFALIAGRRTRGDEDEVHV